MSTTVPARLAAALFTSTSSRPEMASASSTMRRVSSSLRTSPGMAWQLPSRRQDATSSSFSPRRPVMHTVAPSATKRRASAAPMPLPPPVMSAVLPSSCI